MMIKFTVRCQQKRQSQKVQERKNKVSQPQKSLNLTEIIEILKEPKSQRVVGTEGLRGLKGPPRSTHKMSFITFLPCFSYEFLFGGSVFSLTQIN